MPAARHAILYLATLLIAGCAAPRETRPPRNRAAPRTPASPAVKALHRLFAEHWAWQLEEAPLFATMVGVHRYNDRLPSASLTAVGRRLRALEGFLARLERIDAGRLGANDRLNHALFRRLARDQIREIEFQAHLMPITNRSGFHVYFPQLPKRVPLRTVRDYENYIARLMAFRRWTDEHIALLREGIRRGYTLPRAVLKGVDSSISAHIVRDVEKSLLFRPFKKKPKLIPAKAWARLTRAGSQAISNAVVPAYAAFLSFMQAEYVPKARATIAAAALPQGPAFYRHRVRRYTTLDLTPTHIHRVGMREVSRIRGEMLAIIRRVKFAGGFAAFVRFLRTDPRFYAKTADQLMKEVAYVLKKMDGQLPRLFKTLPRAPYGTRKIPAFIAPKTTTAYYQSPAGDGTRAGFYYVNTYNLKSRPLYEIEALSLHEAVPGHHLQIALQQELTGIPQFRRFASFTAFVEGWALYAERLGLEVGFYKDPYRDFGRLTYEMWRACRLVVDTGMHALGWSRKQAIEFMARNTALTVHNITTEVDRYIAWPGQALGYKIGELKIRALRARAEKRLGDRFDRREFHDVVLGAGAIPLTLLEQRIDAWISRRARSPRRWPR